ncbi:hypothetical protein AVEN_244871-1 [Araneus ventricosus]|uniref:Uncharacterized protein n=1 Tax=Araneus ventricosus TaxID=182803 RepID=A0A4Y2AI67_ARAVE|nr:hypothetical protein AVEN_244871-1 [Araneus ventricosus]
MGVAFSYNCENPRNWDQMAWAVAFSYCEENPVTDGMERLRFPTTVKKITILEDAEVVRDKDDDAPSNFLRDSRAGKGDSKTRWTVKLLQFLDSVILEMLRSSRQDGR